MRKKITTEHTEYTEEDNKVVLVCFFFSVFCVFRG